MTKLGLSG
ncbi:hypothetical protein LDH32_13615, partial [Mycobacterium tuberculosis]